MTWHTTSRHERGYGSRWVKLRASILKRDQHLCQPCKAKGRVTPATAVDHIKAKGNGGTDEPSNLRSICAECHKAKTAEDTGKALRPRVTIGPDGWPT